MPIQNRVDIARPCALLFPGIGMSRTSAKLGTWVGVSLLPLSLLLAGCRSCDKVESELRARERESQQLRAEVVNLSAYNQALQREVMALRGGGACAKLPPEALSTTSVIKDIVLGRQTGGLDEDGCPGDEALQVVVEPRDPDGHAIKVPGNLHVDVLEFRPDGFKMPVCSWDVPPEKLRQTWRSGLFTTGYSVTLPWRRWPQGTKVRVVAHFTLTDGRAFEAEKDVNIRSTRPEKRKAAPIGDLIGPPEPDPPTPTPMPAPTQMPMPRELKPAPGPDLNLAPVKDAKPVQPVQWLPNPHVVSLTGAAQLERPRPLGYRPQPE